MTDRIPFVIPTKRGYARRACRLILQPRLCTLGRGTQGERFISASSMAAAIILSLAGTALDRGAFAAPVTDTFLIDQTGTCGLNGTHSQIFEAASANLDSTAADDFDVPTNATWEINQVWATGGYDHGFGPAPYVSVTFYGPGGDVPGAPIAQCSYDNVNTFTDSIGRFVISLPKTCALWGGGAGKKYWVSVRARMDSNHGEWAWDGSSLHSKAAQWQNPGNGFTTNCITWSGIPGCFGNGIAAPDLCFAIKGTIDDEIFFQNGFETL